MNTPKRVEEDGPEIFAQLPDRGLNEEKWEDLLKIGCQGETNSKLKRARPWGASVASHRTQCRGAGGGLAHRLSAQGPQALDP